MCPPRKRGRVEKKPRKRGPKNWVGGATGKKAPEWRYPHEIGMASHDQQGVYRSRYLPFSFPRGVVIQMRLQFKFIGDPLQKKVDVSTIELVKPGGKVQTITSKMLGMNRRKVLWPVILQILEGASLKGSTIELKHPNE